MLQEAGAKQGEDKNRGGGRMNRADQRGVTPYYLINCTCVRELLVRWMGPGRRPLPCPGPMYPIQFHCLSTGCPLAVHCLVIYGHLDATAVR